MGLTIDLPSVYFELGCLLYMVRNAKRIYPTARREPHSRRGVIALK